VDLNGARATIADVVADHQLGPQDAGRTVAVAPGDRVLLSLPENASTGYTWQVEELPPGARVIEERYELPAGGRIGSPSHHVFVLEPPTEQGTLRLHHSRPWEREEGAIERYEVTLAGAGAPPQ
jgi:inhibitor of cysteine peptidase